MNRAEIKNLAKQQIYGKKGTLFLVVLVIGAMYLGVTILNLIPFISFISSIAVFVFLPVFMVSFNKIYLGVAKNQQPEVKELFNNFKLTGKSLGASILKSLITGLALIPFYIVYAYLFFEIIKSSFTGNEESFSTYKTYNSFDGYEKELSKCFSDITLTTIYIFIILMLISIVASIILSLCLSQVENLIADNPTICITDSIKTSFALMKGHKWELFVLNLSFIGWHILSIFTFGILTVAYIIPYECTTQAHFYFYLKQDYIARCNAVNSNNTPNEQLPPEYKGPEL